MKNLKNLFGNKIIGILSGFDRIIIKGTLKNLSYTKGMFAFMLQQKILLKDFNKYVEEKTNYLKNASYEYVKKLERPIDYLSSSKIRKNEYAKEIARRDNISNGLICLLKTVEPCLSYDIYKNRDTKKLELKLRERKCLYFYYYWYDNDFGFMGARLQTWFPFNCYIYINGREWLSKMLEKEGIGYIKHENCFIQIEDFDKSQKLSDKQLETNWIDILNNYIEKINPLYRNYFKELNNNYYWTIYQSEWATDILFKSNDYLQKIYRQITLDAITMYSSEDVMRFLGKKVHGNLTKEIISDYKKRIEGIRIKHSVDANSIKIYDKAGVILRVETTINNPYFFKILRPKEGNKNGDSRLYPLRKSIADIYRRSQISEACNRRYIETLTCSESSVKVQELIAPICKPAYLNNRRARALRPWDEKEIKLYESISRGEYTIGGFRNKNIREQFFDKPESKEEERKMSAKITRYLFLLRAHKLITKIPNTHRYQITKEGKEIIAAILKYNNVSLSDLKIPA